jgi:hypothetical protein
MDFSAWFEAFLGERWFTFDARHNRPRIGRIVMARGRGAADVAVSTSFHRTRLAQLSRSICETELYRGSPISISRIYDFERNTYVFPLEGGEFLMDLERRSQIAERAYYIWQNGGCRHDSSVHDWLQAEAEIMPLANSGLDVEGARKGSASRSPNGGRKPRPVKLPALEASTSAVA